MYYHPLLIEEGSQVSLQGKPSERFTVLKQPEIAYPLSRYVKSRQGKESICIHVEDCTTVVRSPQ